MPAVIEPQSSLVDHIANSICFMPDATHGVVRALDAMDISATNTRIIMTNSYHLARRPGVKTIRALGGFKQMLGWNGYVVTDSGGFQAYSIIRTNPSLGRISNEGLLFAPDPSERPLKLTPEKAILNQLRVGTDLVYCLDDCTHSDADDATQRSSVQRTVQWARRCKTTLDRAVDSQLCGIRQRPPLFGIVQGGSNKALRKQCAEELLEIGFDGYGYGGWPLDNAGSLLVDMLAYTRELIPRAMPMHALGIGHPYGVAACAGMGYQLFDSALPTRDARRGRIYTFSNPSSVNFESRDWLRVIHIGDAAYHKQTGPVSDACDCHTCKHCSVGYLRHLWKIEDASFLRLATIHNLRFMAELTERLVKSKAA